MSEITRRPGDFSNDGRVNGLDAAVLALLFSRPFGRPCR
jgi:hypothetical protein